MFFVYPMWDNESQRIGKKKCTPLGYTSIVKFWGKTNARYNNIRRLASSSGF